ncbi:MAG: diguanylate cyclase [Burkholderiales bacterium]
MATFVLLPDAESERVSTLHAYGVLDTPADENFDELTALAAQLCQMPMAAMTLVDSERVCLKSRAGLEITEAPRAQSFSDHTIRQSELLIVQDTLEDERFKDNPIVVSDPKVRFYAGAPLITPEGFAIGALAVYDRKPRRLTKEQKEVLRVLARQFITQLELTRKLNEQRKLVEERGQAEAALKSANDELKAAMHELEQRGRENASLKEMGDLLQTCLAVEEAYKVVNQFADRLFPGSSGALYVLDDPNELLEAVVGWGDSALQEPVFATDECWALRLGRTHLVEDAREGPTCAHLTGKPKGSTLCVPMMAQGETLGVLHVQFPDVAAKQTQARQRWSVTVGEHLALALANLELREDLMLQAIRDPLTGLFNRRYLEEALEREVLRCARKKRALGMIMLDLDHFKTFNDTSGHEAGDAMLKALSYFLLDNVRAEDIVCRYGGEEFLLIMPEASLDLARQRAEQLRQEVKGLTVQHEGNALGTVTLSLGVAAFPQHGATVNDLLRAADAALYSAKQEGRDRVAVSANA